MRKKVPADRFKKIFSWFQKSNFEIWRNFLRLILVSFLMGWVEAEVPTRKSVGRSAHMLIFCGRMEHLSYTIPTLNFKVKVIMVIWNIGIYPLVYISREFSRDNKSQPELPFQPLFLNFFLKSRNLSGGKFPRDRILFSKFISRKTNLELGFWDFLRPVKILTKMRREIFEVGAKLLFWNRPRSQSWSIGGRLYHETREKWNQNQTIKINLLKEVGACLLYTSDAADDASSV